jgi:transposase InsO family protein
MAWRTADVQEQRIRFAVLAERQGSNVRQLCQEFEICPATGYKWLQRYRAEGVTGLGERSRRPTNSPRRTRPSIVAQIVEQRRQRPDWGARKLQVLLAEQGVQLPVITIHRILLREGLVAAEDRPRAARKRFEREQPNQLWQMDFKGMPAQWKAGWLPLSVLDDHSRYLLGLEALRQTQGKLVRQSLEQIFSRAGLPAAMLMDHGTPWWNMQGAGWTRLSVWLMQQGIRLYFSGYRHPQTQGKVERMHGSLQQALRKRQRPQRSEQWQDWLDEFRHEYNHVRPHQALRMQRPSSFWRPSTRRFDPTPKRWEYAAGAWVQRLGTNGGLWISNKRWEVSRALAGQHVELERVGQRILVRYCRTTVREFNLDTGLSLPVDIRLREFVWPTDNEEAGAGAPGQSRDGAGEGVTPPSL